MSDNMIGTSFDVNEIERQRPPRQGAEQVPTRKRKAALLLYGKLVRALDDLAVFDEVKDDMNRVFEAIKRV